jgi:hypothetical protein
MIFRYNSKEMVRAILCAAGSLFAYSVAFMFFSAGPAIAAETFFGFKGRAILWDSLSLMCLLLVTLSGYRQWRQRGGFYGYHDYSFYLEMEPLTGGSAAVDPYVHRVTGPAYVMTQVCLAGPLLAFKAVSHLHNRILPEPGLEQSLAETLQELQRAQKWQGLGDHPSRRREILLLARMGKIDFSAAKGQPRFKASAPDGN